MKISANPAYPSLFQRFDAKPELFTAWEGTVYRVTTLKYPHAKDILAGKGSYACGGRWNAMGSFCAVYGSTTDIVAVGESRANAEYARIPYPTRTPRLVIAIDLVLARVLDLTQASVRRTLGVTLNELRQEDWRKLQNQGFESLTQALGRAAFSAGAEGLLAPSARVASGVNVVFFPQNLGPSSHAKVWGDDKLAKLPPIADK
jgi:RES domain-containing protein